MFPAEYRNAIFIARHGAWNRTKKTGGDVVVAKLNPDGTREVGRALPDRFPRGQQICRRGPVDVQMMKDGSLLVSDDFNGAVYRVSYGG